MPSITAGRIPIITVAGYEFTDLANLKILFASPKASAGTRYGTYRLMGASAGYQVPVGKSFKTIAMRCDVATISAGIYDIVKYTDDDVGLGAAADGTNPTSAVGTTQINFLATGNNQQYLIPGWTVPASKYVSFDSQGALGGLILIYGYEV